MCLRLELDKAESDAPVLKVLAMIPGRNSRRRTAEGLQRDIIDPCAEHTRRHRYRASVSKRGVMVWLL